MWIIENQLGRRNINNIIRNDLLGRWYNETKNVWGTNQFAANSLNRIPQNEGSSENADIIADQKVRMWATWAKHRQKLRQNGEIFTAFLSLYIYMYTYVYTFLIILGVYMCIQKFISLVLYTYVYEGSYE